MNYKVKVQLPNRLAYLNRCNELLAALRHAEEYPPLFIAMSCALVLRNALGSESRVLRWMLTSIVDKAWETMKSRTWRAWQRYVMRRTDDEIEKVIDRRIELETGVDVSGGARS
jgi:hypothetical protein